MPSKSNSLFHFTREIETILKIIENGFLPMYCTEQTEDLFLEVEKTIAPQSQIDKSNTFPMICFCDIPLTRVDDHVKEYGNYAIGMSQKWGLKNGLTPVWYYHETMPIYKRIQEIYHNYQIRNSNNSYLFSNNFKTENLELVPIKFIELQKCYFKPMKQTIKDEKGKETTKFYHLENEWRYVPDATEYKQTTQNDFFITSEEKVKMNQNILRGNGSPISLKVDISEIEYLIVKNKTDIKKIVENIRKHNWKDVSKIDIDLMLTKIISIYSIKNDF